MVKEWIENNLRGDKMIWFIVAVLSVFSLLAVYSSTGTLAYKYQSGNTEYYFLKHFFLLALGLVIMFFAHKITYTAYSKVARVGLFVVIPMLLFTLLGGTNLNDASRWLTLPVVGLTFQTSDFAKLALILFVARALSRKQDDIANFKEAFLPIIVPVVVVCGLIFPANFSTAAILFTTCLFLMFIGRVRAGFIFGLLGIGVVALALFLGIAKLVNYEGRISTWTNRIENFRNGDSEDNYQAEQAKIAIAKGGVMGLGPGNSETRNFLPHPYSDSIFPIIAEEYGLIGPFIVLLMYILLFYRAVVMVRKSPKAFATLLAFGCSFSLVFQAMINMAVATNIFPVTGQPLPLVSMGGTSMWFTSLSIGILLSVSHAIQKEGGEKVATV